MYKLTRVNGSFPKRLRKLFLNYEEARREIRKYLRTVFRGVPRSTHVPLVATNMYIRRVAEQ